MPAGHFNESLNALTDGQCLVGSSPLSDNRPGGLINVFLRGSFHNYDRQNQNVIRL